jgi:hypothetical protein
LCDENRPANFTAGGRVGSSVVILRDTTAASTRVTEPDTMRARIIYALSRSEERGRASKKRRDS